MQLIEHATPVLIPNDIVARFSGIVNTIRVVLGVELIAFGALRAVFDARGLLRCSVVVTKSIDWLHRGSQAFPGVYSPDTSEWVPSEVSIALDAFIRLSRVSLTMTRFR